MNFTAALDLGLDRHITLCFCPADKKLGKVSTWHPSNDSPQFAIITSVEYWEDVNLTVLLVHCPLAHKRHQYYHQKGYTYDLTYVPHITMCSGDEREKHQHMTGQSLPILGEYVRIHANT